jgi:hypothetical protein
LNLVPDSGSIAARVGELHPPNGAAGKLRYEGPTEYYISICVYTYIMH